MPQRATRPDRLTITTLAIPLLIFLASCGAPAESPQPSETPIPSTSPALASTATAPVTSTAQAESRSGSVRLYFDWSPPEIQALEDLLADFQRDHPGIEIQLTYIPEVELQSRGTTALEEADGPTLLMGPSIWGPELASQGLIRDIGEALSPEMISRIHPMAWSQVESGERVMGLPIEMKGIVLYRNDAIIGDRPGSVDELVLAAQAARSSEVVGASLDFDLLNVLPFLQTCGGELNLDPDQPPFTLEAGLCWLRLLNRLGRSGPPVFGGPEDLIAFREGRSALLIESSDLLHQLRAELGEDNVQIDSWPRYSGSEADLRGYVWTETIYFSAAMSQADFEASWALATFLLAPESQQALASARDVAHQSVLIDLPVDDPASARLRRIFETGVPLPPSGVLERIEPPLRTTVRLVVGAGGDPQLALELALTEIANSSPVQVTPTPTPSPTQG